MLTIILVVGALSLVPGVVARFNMLRVKTVPAVYGELRDERTLSALVVRRETVVKAPQSGNFVLLATEESRVRSNEPIGLIQGDGGQAVIVAPRPGVVRFHWDGWDVPELQMLWQWSSAEWRQRIDSSGRTAMLAAVPGGFVERGEPLMRLVDSHGLLLYVDMPAGAGWRAQQTVTFTMPDVAAEPLRATVVQTGRTSGSDTAVALLELERYIPVLDAIRHVDIHIVLSSYAGVVVPMDALVWNDGTAGVLTRRGSTLEFVPVQIVRQTEDRVVLRGPTGGAQIVVNPSRIASW